MMYNDYNKQINSDSKFCFFSKKQMNNNIQFTKNQKTIIVSLLCIIVVLTSLLLFDNTATGTKRTIMIYIAGSNLETDSAIVTSDLNAINPQKIDLKNTNILLYTGGTKKWHNFISNEDNGIYILKKTGFEQIESLEQLNLGDPNTLTDFLNYGYENYSANKYDLVLYDHGGAIDGAIYDDFSNDNLSLEDLETALKNSKFNDKNKMETVLFRTCLNGTLELANIFKNYSNYLIGSEEISYGANYSEVLGFFNEINNQDTGKEYGIKFVKSYEEQMNDIDPYNSVTTTYSVIDLSKIDEINNELDEYISSIDLNKYYKEIANIRANVYQYGSDASDYDMIDLHEFVNLTGKYAEKDNKKLLKSIENAIVYNKTNEQNSHGISIYFPYKGRKAIQKKFLLVYNKLDFSEEYRKFISKFNGKQNSSSAFSFNITQENKVETHNKNSISLKLTKDQIENYSSSTFTIFEQDTEHINYYKPIHNTNEVMLTEEGMLVANYENKLVKIYNEGDYEYILTYHRKNSNETRYVNAIIYDGDLDILDKEYSKSVDLYLANDNEGNPVISTAKLRSNNERIDGVIIDIKEYDNMELWQHSYRILDENGNVLNTSEWEGAPVIKGYGEKISELKLKYDSLDEGKNYYALFIINDNNGNSSYSKLIKIGE